MTARIGLAAATVGLLLVGLVAPLGATGATGAASASYAGQLVQGPRDIFWTQSQAARRAAHAAKPGPAQLSYRGGLNHQGVEHHPALYLVFWGSQWQRSDPYAAYEQRFFRGLYGPGDDWTPLQREWCDHVAEGALGCRRAAGRVGRPIGGLVKGVWFDDSALAIPTDNPAVTGIGPDAVALEAVRAARHFGNTTAAANRDAQYIINEPSHFDSLGSGLFCGYHSYVDGAYGPIPYTDLPYVTDFGVDCGAHRVNSGDAGAYDGVSIVAGHEFIETLTDPYASTGWLDTNDDENADKCAWVTNGPGAMTDLRLRTGTFAVQGTWSNLARNGAGGCVAHAR